MADIDPHPLAGGASANSAPGLAALLQFEGELRRKESVGELLYFVANDSRPVIAYDQMFVLSERIAGSQMKVMAASGVASVDAQAPFIAALERLVSRRLREGDHDSAQSWQCDDAVLAAEGHDDALKDYPFRHMLWQPMLDRSGRMFGGLLMATAAAPAPAHITRLLRIAEAVAHSWRALTQDRPVRRLRKPDNKEKVGIAVMLAGIALFPVRMTVLAPAEVVPQRPFVIAAPYDGVVSRINVDPHTNVAAGQRLMTLEDVEVRNHLSEAREKIEVARARVDRASNAAFADADSAASLETLRAEFKVAESEYRLAQDLAKRSQITAPRAGTVIYTDRRDWEGKAVSTGEPIMQVVDPKHAVIRVDMPTAQQMTLVPGDDARIWLDAQPLWALEGKVTQVSYQARETGAGVLAFSVIVRVTGAPPQIGSRGSAKLYGRWAPFAYSVLRRPVSALRQRIGL